MSNPFADIKLKQAMKQVATHLKHQNPLYAQLELQLKVIPAPTMTVRTEVIRNVEGSARILILEVGLQGE